MKNEIKIGSLLSIITIIIGAMIQIIYTPLYMKYLGTDDFGINSLVQSIMGYIGILNLGLSNTMLRYIIQYRSTDKKEYESSLNGMFFIIFLLLMVISIIIGILLYINIDTFFSSKFSLEDLEKTKKVFIITMISVILSFPTNVFSNNIFSNEKFIYQKSMNLLRVTLTPLLGSILMINGVGLIGITFLLTTLNLISYGFDIYYSVKLGIKIQFTNFNSIILKEIFIYSFYIFLNAIIDKIYWGTDQIIIGKYIGAIGVGIYSIASIFGQLYMNFSTAISGVLFPKINKLLVEKRYNEISEIFIKVGRLQYFLLGLILTGFILFGQEFIYLWIGKDYEEVYKISLWIMIPLTIPLIQTIGITVLQARNMHKFRSLLYLIISIINIFFSIILVKKNGIIGCAMATGISFVVGHAIIMNIYYYKKVKLNIPLFWKNIYKISIPILISLIFGKMLNIIVEERDYKILILKIVIYILIYIILLFYLALNDYEKKVILVNYIFNKIRK